MYAVKFEADVHNGMIAIPEEYKNLESQHLQITAIVANNTTSPKEDAIEYSDEYIEKNWREIISKALENYDLNYENSFQYKLDRAEFLETKGRL
jgi:hypothetical protein